MICVLHLRCYGKRPIIRRWGFLFKKAQTTFLKWFGSRQPQFKFHPSPQKKLCPQRTVMRWGKLLSLIFPQCIFFLAFTNNVLKCPGRDMVWSIDNFSNRHRESLSYSTSVSSFLLIGNTLEGEFMPRWYGYNGKRFQNFTSKAWF